MEYLQLTHTIRRLGHIVEFHRDNIASTLRSGVNSNHYWAGDHNEEPVGEQSFEPASTGEDSWAYLAGDGASDTDSATSSDKNSLMNNEDIAGMTAGQVDEYLFGRIRAPNADGVDLKSMSCCLKSHVKGLRTVS